MGGDEVHGENSKPFRSKISSRHFSAAFVSTHLPYPDINHILCQKMKEGMHSAHGLFKPKSWSISTFRYSSFLRE